MNSFSIKRFKGNIIVPGDKSISHRSIMLSSLATNTIQIRNLLEGEDVLHTINLFRSCGITINKIDKNYYVEGQGLWGLKEPATVLDVGNSGTTLRLTSGILGAQNFYSVLTGDTSICQRPMRRIISPLTHMNVKIFGRAHNQYPPIAILPSKKIKGITYPLPLPSAQVKSAILFAGLYARNQIIIIENVKTRDHTERLFEYFDIPIQHAGQKIILNNKMNNFKGKDIFIPGDFSSAAFFIVGACITPDSKIVIQDVGLNPTRTGLLNVLKRMGAKITLSNIRKKNNEEIGTITALYSNLQGIEINPEEIPLLIDEIPILSIAALHAKGFTILKGAKELRVKESDRIKSITDNLKLLGAKVKELEDGFIINGQSHLNEKKVIDTHNDHRMAMSFIIASSLLKKGILLNEIDSIKTSFPNFIKLINKVNI